MNINGQLSRLENSECLAYMTNFDIIVLVEVKCSFAFSVPGFEIMRSAGRSARGGVAVLVKHCVALCLC